jgi:hypothetical protein
MSYPTSQVFWRLQQVKAANKQERQIRTSKGLLPKMWPVANSAGGSALVPLQLNSDITRQWKARETGDLPAAKTFLCLHVFEEENCQIIFL